MSSPNDGHGQFAQWQTARACIATFRCDLDRIIATRIKTNSSAVVKHKISWTIEDLVMAGVPERLRQHAYELLEVDAEKRDYWIKWETGHAPGLIAHWLLNPRRIPEQVDLDWWREMFAWAYGIEIEKAREGLLESWRDDKPMPDLSTRVRKTEKRRVEQEDSD